MAIDVTREELRSDIFEITTSIIKDNNQRLMRMINEDLSATNERIDALDRRLTKRIDTLSDHVDVLSNRVDALGEKIDFTHKLLHVHVANPSAHSRSSTR